MKLRKEGAEIGHRYEHELGLAQEFKKLELHLARIRTRTRLGAAVSSHEEEEEVDFSEHEADFSSHRCQLVIFWAVTKDAVT